MSTSPHHDYVHDRRYLRLLGGALAFGTCLPVLSRGARAFAQRAVRRRGTGGSFFDLVVRARGPERPLSTAQGLWLDLWLPRSVPAAAVLGLLGGYLEDRHARLAWDDIVAGDLREPAMWTARTLVPALLTFVNPLLGWKCQDGEMKGANAALARCEERDLLVWPFFAVLDSGRPSHTMAAVPYHHQHQHQHHGGAGAQEAAMAGGSGGIRSGGSGIGSKSSVGGSNSSSSTDSSLGSHSSIDGSGNSSSSSNSSSGNSSRGNSSTTPSSSILDVGSIGGSNRLLSSRQHSDDEAEEGMAPPVPSLSALPWSVLAHLLYYRLVGGGFYEVLRRPENEKWHIY